MRKILIPIDFSAAAKYGFEYAEWLSLSSLSEMVAVHVADLPTYDETLSMGPIQQIAKQKEEDIAKHLKRFTTPYPDHDQEALTRIKNLRCEIRFGAVVDQILNFSEAEQIDLIVIGTCKKHSLWDHLFGSVTTQLLARSPIPVLVVPEGCAFKPIEKIAFANAITGEETPALVYLQDLARQWKAQIEQVYVNTMPYDFLHNKEEVWELPNPKLGKQKVNMVREANLEEGLDFFTAKEKIDLIAMMAPQRDRLKSIWRRYQRKAVAYHTDLPLLVIPAAIDSYLPRK